MTNSKVILTTIKQNLYIEVNLNMSSAKRRLFCLCSMAKEQPVAPPYQFRAKVTLYNSSWTNGGRVTNMHGTKLGHLWSWWLFVSGRHQAITWTNAGNCKLGLRRKHQWNFNRNWYISFKKIHVNMSCWIWRSFCLGLIVSTDWGHASSKWLTLTHPASNAI